MDWDKIMTFIKWGAAAMGGMASYLLGGFDKLILFLILLTAIDIITGLLKAAHNGSINSTVTLKGLIRKAGIYVIVAVCHLADQALGLTVLRDGAVSFYIVMELISITENWGQMGLPLPQQLKNILAQLQEPEEPSGVKLHIK